MSGMSKEEGIAQVYGGGGHVVILGAGASIASTIRNPELTGKLLTSMDNFIQVLELGDLVQQIPPHLQTANFETLYSGLHSYDPSSVILAEFDYRIHKYFSDMELPETPTIYDYLVLSLRNKDMIATF